MDELKAAIDNLIKGDVEIMKEHVRSEERNEFKRLTTLYFILFVAMMVSPIPLAYYLKIVGIVIWAALAAVTLFVAFAIEKRKKQYDIQTYREIIAFSEGKSWTKLRKSGKWGKDPTRRPC